MSATIRTAVRPAAARDIAPTRPVSMLLPRHFGECLVDTHSFGAYAAGSTIQLWTHADEVNTALNNFLNK